MNAMELVTALKAVGVGKPTVITDTTTTAAVLPNVQGGKVYQYTQPLTSLTVSAVTSSELESEIRFSAGTTATVCSWASGIKWHGGEAPTIEANKEYVVSIKALYGVYGDFAEVSE